MLKLAGLLIIVAILIFRTETLAARSYGYTKEDLYRLAEVDDVSLGYY